MDEGALVIAPASATGTLTAPITSTTTTLKPSARRLNDRNSDRITTEPPHLIDSSWPTREPEPCHTHQGRVQGET